MPSTTIHFPDEILSDIDRIAGRQKISRNKFVIEACRSAMARDAGEWPDGFFDGQLSDIDQNLLREAVLELEDAVIRHRRNRGAPLL